MLILEPHRLQVGFYPHSRGKDHLVKILSDKVINRIVADTIAVLESSEPCRNAIRAHTMRERLPAALHGDPRFAPLILGEDEKPNPGVDVVNLVKELHNRGQIRYNTGSQEDATWTTLGAGNSAIISVAM